MGVLGVENELKQRKSRDNHARRATDKLRAWFVTHSRHPYPTEREKIEVMRQTGLCIGSFRDYPISRVVLIRAQRKFPRGSSTLVGGRFLQPCGAPASEPTCCTSLILLETPPLLVLQAGSKLRHAGPLYINGYGLAIAAFLFSQACTPLDEGVLATKIYQIGSERFQHVLDNWLDLGVHQIVRLLLSKCDNMAILYYLYVSASSLGFRASKPVNLAALSG